MKKIARGRTIGGLVLAGVIFFTPITTQAGELVKTNVNLGTSSEITVAPRADVIVRKYRKYNDVLQYRRWNETRGYWVDPEWINMP